MAVKSIERAAENGSKNTDLNLDLPDEDEERELQKKNAKEVSRELVLCS